MIRKIIELCENLLDMKTERLVSHLKLTESVITGNQKEHCSRLINSQPIRNSLYVISPGYQKRDIIKIHSFIISRPIYALKI